MSEELKENEDWDSIDREDVEEGGRRKFGAFTLGDNTYIKDYKLFREFLKVRNNPLIVNHVIHFSDPLLEPKSSYVLAQKGLKYIQNYCEGLPQEEIDAVWKRVQDFSRLRIAYMQFGRNCFGKRDFNDYYDMEDWNFLNSKKTEVVELFGQFLDEARVKSYLQKEFGVTVSITSLVKWRRMNSNPIDKKRDEYRREWKQLKLSHKRSWLEELQELYYDRKSIYYEEGKNRLDYIQLLNTIKLIRDVAIDAGQKLELHIDHKVDVVINQAIGEEILKNLPVLEIIIGRVAHKMNVPAAKVLQRLQTSLYAKFTGVNTQSKEDLEEVPMYPSQMVYDWKAIESVHKQPTYDIETVEVTEAEMERGKRLLDIINQKVSENKHFLEVMNSSIRNSLENEGDS